MRQAIACTISDPDHWWIYAALGGDELIKMLIQHLLIPPSIIQSTNVSLAGYLFGTERRSSLPPNL